MPSPATIAVALRLPIPVGATLPKSQRAHAGLRFADADKKSGAVRVDGARPLARAMPDQGVRRGRGRSSHISFLEQLNITDLFADLLAASDRPVSKLPPARDPLRAAAITWLSTLLLSWLAPPQPLVPAPPRSDSKAAEASESLAAQKLSAPTPDEPSPLATLAAAALPLLPISAPEIVKPASQPNAAPQEVKEGPINRAPVATPSLPMSLAPTADSKLPPGPTTPPPAPTAVALELVPAAKPADSSARTAPPLPVFTFHAQLRPAPPAREPQPAPPSPPASAAPENTDARATGATSPSMAEPEPRELAPVPEPPSPQPAPSATGRPMEHPDPEPPAHDLPAKLTERPADFAASPFRPVSRATESAPRDPDPQRREAPPEHTPAVRAPSPESQPARSEPRTSQRRPENSPLASQPLELEPAIEKATVRPLSSGSELQLLLRPEHLGRVAVHLIERGGLVEVAVRTDNQPLKNLLAETLPSLVDGMHRQGFQISRVAPGEGDSPLGWWTAEEQTGRGGRERRPPRRQARPGAPSFAFKGDFS